MTTWTLRSPNELLVGTLVDAEIYQWDGEQNVFDSGMMLLEVYLTPFPDGGSKLPVSTGGGGSPVWSHDGDVLYYRNRHRILSVDVGVSERDGLKLGPAVPLLEMDFSFENQRHLAYDVTPDGDRFLLIEETGSKDHEIKVVLNWHEELERLVPSGRR